MKKLLAKFSLIFFIMLGLSLPQDASAQIPFGFTFGFAEEIEGIMADIQATLKTVETNVVGRIKGTLGKLQSAYDKYSGKITKVFDKIPGTKDFKIGSALNNSLSGQSGSSYQNIDIYDPEAVKEAFMELFFTYPSEDKVVQLAYNKKSNKFYYDTLVEVKATIPALEKQLDVLRKEVDDFSAQAMSGSEEGGEASSSGGESDGAASSEDDSGIIYNAYLSNRKFNDILKVTEEVIALQNQYFAARLLRFPREVEPAQPEDKTQNDSFLYFHKRFDNAQFLKRASDSISEDTKSDNKTDTLVKEQAVTSAKTEGSLIKEQAVTSAKTEGSLIKEQAVTSAKTEGSLIKEQAITSAKTEGSLIKAQAVTSAKTEGSLIKEQAVTSAKTEGGLVKEQAVTSAKVQDNISPKFQTTIFTKTQENNLTKAQTQNDALSAKSVNSLVSTDSSAKKSTYADDFFDVPEAPETSSPLKHSQAELDAINKISEIQTLITKAEEVHNLLQQLPSYRDTFVQFGLIQQLHNKAVTSVALADQCVLKYLGYYYTNPNKVWFGQNTVPAQTCDYDNRTGLSGWAITEYQLANAASGNNIDINEMMDPIPGVEDGDPELTEVNTSKLNEKSKDFVVVDIDTSEYSDSVRETDPEKLTEERDGETESFEDNFTDSDKAKEFSNSSREVSLINWQIGKKAAQILAEDQYSANPIYGEAYHPYPLWNDQRSYYDQYISGKYKNMKAYLNQLNLNNVAIQIVEIFNGVTENEEEKSANESDISSLKEAISSNVGVVDNLNNLIQSKNSAVNALKQQETNSVSSLQNKIDKINKNIDNWTQLISTNNEEINRLSEENTHSEGTMESSKHSMLNLEKRGMSLISSLFSQAKQALQEAAEKLKSNIPLLGNLRSSVKQFENARKLAKAQAGKLQEKIDTTEQRFQEDIQAVESEFDMSLDTLQNSIPTPKLSNVYTAANIENLSLLPLIAKADIIVDKARECASELIEEHLASLQATAEGDVLYKKSNHHNLVVKHIQLINQLKNLPTTCLNDTVAAQIGTLNIVPTSIMSLLRNIFQTAITNDICSQYTCDAADTEYFVGLPAKARDFTAPKAALTKVYPTVRDILHFDTTDYKNIKMTKEGTLFKEAFLESGAELPEIWELMLSGNAYVEKDINLAEALNKGGEGKAFMRGFMLPCRLDKYIIDINENNGKYAVVDTVQDNSPDNISRYNKLSNCRELKMTAHLLEAYTIKDTDVKDNIQGRGFPEIRDPISSELGMLLKYNNYRLSMNNDAYEGFERLVKKEKKAEKKGKYELKAEDNVYQRAMFTKNQIGDFLHFMDKEKSAREKLEQAEDDIADLRVTLKEAVSALGFELDDNVNLANDEEYDEVVQKLRASKTTVMDQIAGKIHSIDHSNPDVDERYQKVHNTYIALLQDDKALVSINDNTESGSAMEESIKSEKANQKVVEKSREDGYKALLDEINNYEQPICIPNGTILPSYTNNN